MRPPKAPPIERHPPEPDRMWPLDVLIGALASLVLYLIVTRLQFDDPRWFLNAWTYVIAVPVIALVLAFLMHGVASHYLRQSVQLGFLFSVFVHLLLLMLAVNMIVFMPLFPDAFTGVKPERSPLRRTVPEYLFQSPQEKSPQPDWSQPVDVETASPVIPEEQRQLPPVEHSAPKLEIPKPRDPDERPAQKFLLKRPQPSDSLPQPADEPAKLARRERSHPEPTESLQSPTAPTVPAQTEPEQASAERAVTRQQRARQAMADLASVAPKNLPEPQRAEPRRNERSLSAARQQSAALPVIGDAGLQRQRSHRSPANRISPAGAAPAPQTITIARELEQADRMLAPIDSPFTRQGETVGALLTMGDTPGVNPSTTNQQSVSGVEVARNEMAARAGVPDVTAGQSPRSPGRTRRPATGGGFSPAGVPDPASLMASAARTGKDPVPGAEIGDRLELNEAISGRTRQGGTSVPQQMSAASSAAPTLDLMLQEGPIGLGSILGTTAGIVPSHEQPQIAALDLNPGSRARRDVGGPITPFGTKIAAVESFNRRVLRTKGGAAPTPAGVIGPATEEAIERGLAYLASVQNDDGSWSLQGHGSDAVLRSDTAATGLCLLAFQGAGYTHRQHQYADTVSRGLKFLMDNQRTNGDLYRSENPLSDRNVAFYSHGIAALAMCEAYGMTQDPELQESAQSSLDYIAGTQHHSRGGWRYTAQVSSDTSVTGWMMMALKSGQLSGLQVAKSTYDGIQHWLDIAQESPERQDRYRYNPFAPDTPSQRHGRVATPTMTAVGMLMRMYSGWRRDTPEMQSAAEYLLKYPPQVGTPQSPQRDTYYWYYATQVMFHMGGDYWARWNRSLNPVLLDAQIKEGPYAGSWDPMLPVPDRWSPHAGRLYVSTMNLLNLEVYYRHLPIYEDTAE